MNLWRKVLVGVAFCVPLAVAACRDNLPTAVGQLRTDANSSDRVGLHAAIDAKQSNRNQCVAQTPVLGADGKVTLAISAPVKVAAAFDDSTKEVALFSLVQFDPKSRKSTKQIDCVLPDVRDEAMTFLLKQFGGTPLGMRSEGINRVALMNPSYFSCSYTWGENKWECHNGSDCEQTYQLRAPNLTVAERIFGTTQLIEYGTGPWSCDNGCNITAYAPLEVTVTPDGCELVIPEPNLRCTNPTVWGGTLSCYITDSTKGSNYAWTFNNGSGAFVDTVGPASWAGPAVAGGQVSVTYAYGGTLGLFGGRTTPVSVPRRTGPAWKWDTLTNLLFRAANGPDLDPCNTNLQALAYVRNAACATTGVGLVYWHKLPTEFDSTDLYFLKIGSPGPNHNLWYVNYVVPYFDVRAIISKRYRGAESYSPPIKPTPGVYGQTPYYDCGLDSIENRSVFYVNTVGPCAPDNYFGGILDSIVLPHEWEHFRLLKEKAMEPLNDVRKQWEQYTHTDQSELMTRIQDKAIQVTTDMHNWSAYIEDTTNTATVRSRPFTVWYYFNADTSWRKATSRLILHK